jgi:hypothetical protein
MNNGDASVVGAEPWKSNALAAGAAGLEVESGGGAGSVVGCGSSGPFCSVPLEASSVGTSSTSLLSFSTGLLATAGVLGSAGLFGSAGVLGALVFPAEGSAFTACSTVGLSKKNEPGSSTPVSFRNAAMTEIAINESRPRSEKSTSA